jgi:predicted ABC-type ATPase
MITKTIYIISGPNGAGKTTASFTILPEIFDCKQFVNADEIAKGLSPFNVESVKIQAGRLMLKRIQQLVNDEETFAIETTLATKSYLSLIKIVQEKGYEIVLLFISLASKELALKRVQTRVLEGGHNIPEEIIFRRFENGIKNLIQKYIKIVDKWILVDNTDGKFQFIAEGSKENIEIKNKSIWSNLIKKYGN